MYLLNFSVLDNVLGITILAMTTNISAVFGTLVVICYSTPVFLTVVVPLIVMYYFIQVSSSVTNAS